MNDNEQTSMPGIDQLDREWLYDRTTVTTTVQEVANRLHGDGEHLALHSCPCFNLARYYLGLDEAPKMYWPDSNGGNAWDKKPAIPITETVGAQGGEDYDFAYAQRLAKYLAATHFPDDTDFILLPDMSGVLSQIDNMIMAWPKSIAAAELRGQTDGRAAEVSDGICQRCGLKWLEGHDCIAASYNAGQAERIERAAEAATDALYSSPENTTRLSLVDAVDKAIRALSPIPDYTTQVREEERTFIRNEIIKLHKRVYGGDGSVGEYDNGLCYTDVLAAIEGEG